VAAAVNLLLVTVAVIFKPGGGSSLVKVSWSFGAFAGLIAAIAAFAPLARAALRAQPGRGAQKLTRDSARRHRDNPGVAVTSQPFYRNYSERLAVVSKRPAGGLQNSAHTGRRRH
jgi:hypothetical protein